MWPDYLKGGYFEGKDAMGNPALRPEFVSRERVKPLVQAMAEAHPALTSHQVRRFFQQCRAIEARLRAGKAGWESEHASFVRLDAAAADAIGKREPKIPRLFHDFIMRNVEAVKTEHDFLAGFLPHFEALIGFGSSHLKEKERSQ
jgi:CRISPR/Cas system CSM-associated protein Csm2 small subunit